MDTGVGTECLSRCVSKTKLNGFSFELNVDCDRSDAKVSDLNSWRFNLAFLTPGRLKVQWESTYYRFWPY